MKNNKLMILIGGLLAIMFIAGCVGQTPYQAPPSGQNPAPGAGAASQINSTDLGVTQGNDSSLISNEPVPGPGP